MSTAKVFGKLFRSPWLWGLGLLLLAGAIQEGGARHRTLVEAWYSRGVFPPIAGALGLINRFLPFSLAEVGLVSLIPLGVAFGYHRLRVWRRAGRSWPWKIRRTIEMALVVVGIGAVVFQFFWGMNYHRLRLGEQFGFGQVESNEAELVSLAEWLADETNQSLRATGQAGGGATRLDSGDIAVFLDRAYQGIDRLGPAVRVRYGRPKPVFFSEWMARMGISGVYSPFTGEANYNTKIPECEKPFTLAHEMAHQRGIASEDEANFLAFLVCRAADNAYCRYSGNLLALTYVLNDLADDEKAYRDVWNRLDPAAVADFEVMRAFWERHRGVVMDVSSEVNNAYLKANKVESGIRSYSEVVSLIVAYRRKGNPAH